MNRATKVANWFAYIEKAKNAKISPRNEKSPAALIGSRGVIEVALKSISFPTPNSAIVRFRLQNVGSVTGFENNRDMIVDMDFRFADIKLSVEERYINPLGFQVTKYVIDRELVRGSEER